MTLRYSLFPSVFLGLGPVLALVLACVTGPRPALARDLAFLQDNSAKITILDGWRCSSRATVTVESATAALYDAQVAYLGTLFGAALNNLLQSCPKLTEVTIRGRVDGTAWLEAKSSAAQGWQMAMELPRLEQAATTIPDRIKDFDDLPRLASIYQPYRAVPGVAETRAFRTFATFAQNTVLSIAGDPAGFDAYVRDKLDEMADDKAADEVEKALEVVAIYDRNAARMLRMRFAKLRQDIMRAEWTGVLSKALTPQTGIAEAARQIGAQLQRRPVAASDLGFLDDRLASWIERRLQQHDAAHPGTELADLAADRAIAEALERAEVPEGLNASRAAVDEAALAYAGFLDLALAEQLGAAQAIIDETGTGFADVDLVVETGLALSEEFRNHGFDEIADTLSEHAGARSTRLIEAGLAGYRAELDTREMDRDGIAAVQAEIAAFAELSSDFPGFDAYVETAEAALVSGRARACAGHAAAIENGARIVIETGDSARPLAAFACALYDNDHILAGFDVAGGGDGAVLSIDSADQGVMEFTLADLGPTDGGQLYGAGTDADGMDWDATIAELLIRPPSGVPDRSGITECDLLAGDPSDPDQPAPGVKLEDTPPDYDFDRAIDACIAAVEHDPGATRQLYQLGRVLDFLGDAENAQPYIDAAAERAYPPALHLKATQTLMTQEGDDAFFDAIDLYREASKLGFAPAKAELAALVPPGTELYREIPEPTDKDVMGAVRSKICEGFAGMGACVYRTGVASKKCFQVAAEAFSCEVVLTQRCEMRMGNDPLMRLLSDMTAASCPRRTDPLFLRMTKKGNSWTARSEM
ncbi:hypothetical protein CVM52_16175 [Pseudooceanicola lipolyticus]|uniref:Tetratricopeptide repeat protein n=1 Tax=Pseudooceanicola lipolyticus TaxID=2029104 RepID=A0A2M8IYM0_9RHOB|nr:hypothetical protein [Pseudooceanicola lipolyticus]PJE35627.1 hypothetical protein CVM52_16175 [Pseudooceanicola lipolyticus]